MMECSKAQSLVLDKQCRKDINLGPQQPEEAINYPSFQVIFSSLISFSLQSLSIIVSSLSIVVLFSTNSSCSVQPLLVPSVYQPVSVFQFCYPLIVVVQYNHSQYPVSVIQSHIPSPFVSLSHLNLRNLSLSFSPFKVIIPYQAGFLGE